MLAIVKVINYSVFVHVLAIYVFLFFCVLFLICCFPLFFYLNRIACDDNANPSNLANSAVLKFIKEEEQKEQQQQQHGGT